MFFSPEDLLIAPVEAKRPLQWTEHFPSSGPLEVEIGFGLGEVLTRKALEFPEHNFIGLEVHGERLKKAARRIFKNNLRNVRLMKIDARVFLERFLPPSSVHGFYSLFPCPWPKRGHAKHRLFSHDFLKLVNSRLADGGMMTVVTDFLPYREWMRGEAKDSGFRTRAKTIPARYDTKFERKWQEAGQNNFYELSFFKERHINFPLIKDAQLKSYFVERFNPSRFTLINQRGNPAVIFKDFLFDARREKGMVHLLIAEGHLVQHVWIEIVRQENVWRINPVPANFFIPTVGIVRGLEMVYEACLPAGRQATTETNNPHEI